jgi:predicted DNA-binding protein (MmcQ/YjbR family)
MEMKLKKTKTKYMFVLFWPFVTSKNERQIAVRELSQPFASVRHRSQWFAVVRSGSPPFAAVRHRSQWFAAVRSGSPPFAVSLKLNIRYSFNKIRETKNIKSLFLILKINNFELKKIVFKMKNFKKGNCLIS